MIQVGGTDDELDVYTRHLTRWYPTQAEKERKINVYLRTSKFKKKDKRKKIKPLWTLQCKIEKRKSVLMIKKLVLPSCIHTVISMHFPRKHQCVAILCATDLLMQGETFMIHLSANLFKGLPEPFPQNFSAFC